MAVDHGRRRIGVAVADVATGIAFPRPAVRTRPGQDKAVLIGQLARGEGAELVVVGLPRNMDGSEGAQAAAARAFGARLVAIGLSVVYADERLTSWEAGERLVAQGVRPDRQSGALDSAAACLILQDYLDARARPGDVMEAE
jgi:putative Holliday junction resolvase